MQYKDNKKVTQNTIAEALHLSRNTVSKALNRHPKISHATCDMVIRKAQELGYLPSDEVESVQRLEIGLLCMSSTISTYFWSNMIRGVEYYLNRSQVPLRLSLVSLQQVHDRKLPPILKLPGLSAIIMVGSFPKEYYTMVCNQGLPTIMYDMDTSLFCSERQSDFVLINDRCAVETITERLIQKGHQNIAFVGRPDFSVSFRQRFEGYQVALINHRLSPLCIPALMRVDNCASGMAEMDLNEIFRSVHPLPTAFVCANDPISYYINRFRSRPDCCLGNFDISGFDNSDRYTEMPAVPQAPKQPLFATVDSDSWSIGRVMAQQILSRIKDPEQPFRTIFLDAKVLFFDNEQK